MDAITVPDWWQRDASGAELTSMKVGGSIDYLARPHTIEQLRETFAVIREHNLTYKVFGAGSNLILPDDGIRGVVVRPAFNQMEMVEDVDLETVPALARYEPERGEQFLNLSESTRTGSGEYRYIELGAGMPWGQAVVQTLKKNLSGLHWFARIPCYVGGAVYNNIHGGAHLLSETVVAVKWYDPETDTEHTSYASELGFGYDMSIFHQNHGVITAAWFRLELSSPEVAKADLDHYVAWTKEKARIQPAGANCGSVFQNLTKAQAEAAGQTATSAGWYIDQCGWKGKQYGEMQVYPGHANFIVNHGGGTQADFKRLVEDIRQSVLDRFGIVLQPEAECIDNQGITYIWPTPKSAPAS